jgi:hypothetical protein
MPPAKKPATTRAKKPATTSRPRPRPSFKEPAALKRLSRSLDSAHEALTDLRKDTGSGVSQGARDLHTGVRAFVSNARRDAGKLSKALQRDFEQAQKQLAVSKRSSAASRTAARGRTTARRAPAKRGARKPA